MSDIVKQFLVTKLLDYIFLNKGYKRPKPDILRTLYCYSIGYAFLKVNTYLHKFSGTTMRREYEVGIRF